MMLAGLTVVLDYVVAVTESDNNSRSKVFCRLENSWQPQVRVPAPFSECTYGLLFCVAVSITLDMLSTCRLCACTVMMTVI
jgi:hypothetical protein